MNYKEAYASLMEAVSKAIDEIEKSRIISKETEDAVRILKEGLKAAKGLNI